MWDLFQVLPSRKAPKKVSSSTNTHGKQNPGDVITVPQYLDHTVDLTLIKSTTPSGALMRHMFKHDSDLSATVGSYLTLADTTPTIIARTPEGEIDPEATRAVHQLLKSMGFSSDPKAKYKFRTSFRSLCQEIRYMALLRGGTGLELVLNKNYVPDRLQHVDMATIEWTENISGDYKPIQVIPGGSDTISLDIPTFFTSFHRRDPTNIYPQSEFVAAINLITARQQIINDLYRIMHVMGFPRMTIKVLEEVMINNAPADVKKDPQQLAQWVSSRVTEITNRFANLKSDQAFVHSDSIEVGVVNKDKPGASLQIKEVIDTINSQSQAAMKTMATIIGRGTQGVNTASVEARIAAMNADQLNIPVAEVLERALTFALNLSGTVGYVEVEFAPAELRPRLELEPQQTMRASRLKEDLSLGIITDEEYHLQMYNRLPPKGYTPLAGTGFMNTSNVSIDTDDVTPNSDPLGRSLAPEGSSSAKSN